ncbi:MAG: hypothetical protein H7039_18195 [Bryobacteraceae bacterium]|nr:hypothetical protein [Bryobacteraceae bacterium]
MCLHKFSLNVSFRAEEYRMDRFYADAQNIMTTALGVLASGHRPTDMVILTGVQGQIQMLAECDWPLESIRVERGANSAYRVTSGKGTVVVDGNQRGRVCRLEHSIAPARIPSNLLSSALPFWMEMVTSQPRLLESSRG